MHSENKDYIKKLLTKLSPSHKQCDETLPLFNIFFVFPHAGKGEALCFGLCLVKWTALHMFRHGRRTINTPTDHSAEHIAELPTLRENEEKDAHAGVRYQEVV